MVTAASNNVVHFSQKSALFLYNEKAQNAEKKNNIWNSLNFQKKMWLCGILPGGLISAANCRLFACFLRDVSSHWTGTAIFSWDFISKSVSEHFISSGSKAWICLLSSETQRGKGLVVHQIPFSCLNPLIYFSEKYLYAVTIIGNCPFSCALLSLFKITVVFFFVLFFCFLNSKFLHGGWESPFRAYSIWGLF